jgi:ubiquinone biosynthesis protein
VVFAGEIHLGLNELIFVGVPFAVIVGWLSGRILGVRRGWPRALVAGFLGWFVGVIVAVGTVDTADELGDVWLLSLFFGLLAAMVISIVLDVVLRPKRRRRVARIPHPIRSIKRRLAPFGRFREILHHARKRGLTELRYASMTAMATPEFARRLRLTLEDCGGMFVKFGQIASTRNDLLPEALTTELAQLQSAVRPIPLEEVHAVIEDELGATVAEEFATFADEPLASASIGQTHRATLASGEPVVVKVQRPGIEDTVRRDTAVLRMVAGVLERRVEAARHLGVRDLADELIASLQRELDYTTEAANGEAFREHTADEPGISAPVVFRALSTRRVLVMEEVQGESVADREAVAACGVPPPELAQRLLSSFLEQVLRAGTYHADPHPGNIFVDSSGVLWFLDFGAMGHLDPILLEALQQMAIGFQLHDPVVLARAARQAAGVQEMPSSRALEADIGLLLSEGISSGSIDPTTMREMLDVMQRHGMRPPRAMTVLSRALITLEGTLRTIDPSFNIARAAEDLLPSMAESTPAMFEDELKKELLRSLPSLRTLPTSAEDIAALLKTGRLTIRTARFGDDRDAVDTWVDRVVFAAVGGLGLLSSALLLTASGTVDVEGMQQALQAIGFFGLVIASVMQMRTIAQIMRRSGQSQPTGRAERV